MVNIKLNGHASWIMVGLVILSIVIGWSTRGATMEKSIEVNAEKIQVLKQDVKEDIGLLREDVNIIKSDVKELLKRK